MESKEDSIKILEMRIRHQMNRSLEKNTKPENMQYFLSPSAMPWQKGLRQDADNAENEELRQAVHVDRQQETRQEIRGDEPETSDRLQYENQPFDTSEYIDQVGGLIHMMESVEISEPKEAQRARARNGYERVHQSLDTQKSSEIGKNHFFDVKG